MNFTGEFFATWQLPEFFSAEKSDDRRVTLVRSVPAEESMAAVELVA